MILIMAGVMAAFVSAFFFVKLKDAGKRNGGFQMKWFVPAMALYIVFDCSLIHCLSENGCSVSGICSAVFLVNAMLLLAVVDFRYRIIPNEYIFALIIVRTACIIFQGIETGNIIAVFVCSAVGMVTGFIVLALIALVSGKGLGCGDIKMYAVIGYFIGCSGVLDILIYSSVFCTVTGLLLIAAKRCRMKSLVPMAPFAFMGTILYFLIYINEGVL